METDVPRRREPPVHQSSTTPIASPDAAGGGTDGELDSSTPLGRVAYGLAALRIEGELYDAVPIALGPEGESHDVATTAEALEAFGERVVDHRDTKPEKVRKPPAKAWPRDDDDDATGTGGSS